MAVLSGIVCAIVVFAWGLLIGAAVQRRGDA